MNSPLSGTLPVRSRPAKQQAALRKLVAPLRSAFTLVEIAISMGIVSFAMVALIGVIPVGLSARSSAVGMTSEALIAQHLFADAQLSPYSELSKLAKSNQPFTEEARKTEPNDAMATYQASVTISPDWRPPGMAAIQGAPASGLTLMKVEIVRISDPSRPRVYTNVIADRGF